MSLLGAIILLMLACFINGVSAGLLISSSWMDRERKLRAKSR